MVVRQSLVFLLIKVPIMSSIRMDSGFDDTIGAVGEKGVGVLDAAERIEMGYQMSGIDLTFGNELHDFIIVAGIDTAGLKCQILAIHTRQWQYLLFLIECDNRDNGIRTVTTPCEFKSILASGNLNHAVGSATIGKCAKYFNAFWRLDYIDKRIILSNKFTTALIGLANNYVSRIIQLNTFLRT